MTKKLGKLLQVYKIDGKVAHHGYIISLNQQEVEKLMELYSRSQAAEQGEDTTIQHYLHVIVRMWIQRDGNMGG